MKIKMFEKPVMTKFVTINDIEFEASDLFCALEQISRTEEDDHYGDYSLRDYELSCSRETITNLVKIGLVKNYIGPRMANLYCIADAEGVNDLIYKLYELDEEMEKDKE